MEVSQNSVYLFGGPYNKDYNIIGSILGYRNFGKLPYVSHNSVWSVARLTSVALWRSSCAPPEPNQLAMQLCIRNKLGERVYG